MMQKYYSNNTSDAYLYYVLAKFYTSNMIILVVWKCIIKICKPNTLVYVYNIYVCKYYIYTCLMTWLK